MMAKEAYGFRGYFMKEAFELVYDLEWMPSGSSAFEVYTEMPAELNVPKHGRD